MAREAMCFECLSINEPLQAHHPSYLDMERVVWLCPACHRTADREARVAEADSEAVLLGNRIPSHHFYELRK